MASAPAISVVMPLYRSQKFLKEAIESVLQQTFGDFEFLILVDNATDETVNILHEYKKSDSRIKIYYNDGIGLINSLNLGFKEANGKYFVRMDSDDICLPTRLEKQYQYMEKHPEIGILGTSFEIINDSGNTTCIFQPVKNPKVIKWRLIFDNCLTHSSVIIRSSIIEKIGYYRLDAKHAEDYDLWVRASHVTNIANHPDVLMKYRIHDESVSSIMLDHQENIVKELVYNNINNLLDYNATEENIFDIRNFVRGNGLNNLDKIEKTMKILFDLYAAYIDSNRLSVYEVNLITNDLMTRIIKNAIKERQLPVIARIKLCYDALGLKIKSYSFIVRYWLST